MLAQIDPIGTLVTGISAADEAGIAIVSLVLLIVLTLSVGFIVRFYYRNQREERVARERREQSERQEREQERAAREAERKMYVEAAATANSINQMLMDRLEKLTETHEQMESNVGTQTEGIKNLMTAIEASESTRAERYQKLFDRQGTTEEALNTVATELHGVKASVDALTVKVDAFENLNDADRAMIAALSGKIDKLYNRLEGESTPEAAPVTETTTIASVTTETTAPVIPAHQEATP